MEEKKLTDEELIKALECCYNAPCCSNECPYFNKHGRNFCVEDKALYKDMKRIVQEHAEQKTEIERLTEENGQIFDKIYDFIEFRQKRMVEPYKDALTYILRELKEEFGGKNETV